MSGERPIQLLGESMYLDANYARGTNMMAAIERRASRVHRCAAPRGSLMGRLSASQSKLETARWQKTRIPVEIQQNRHQIGALQTDDL